MKKLLIMLRTLKWIKIGEVGALLIAYTMLLAILLFGFAMLETIWKALLT